MPFGNAVCPLLPHISIKEAIVFKCMVSTKLHHYITNNKILHKKFHFSQLTPRNYRVQIRPSVPKRLHNIQTLALVCPHQQQKIAQSTLSQHHSKILTHWHTQPAVRWSEPSMSFAFNSSLMSVDGMTCLLPFES
jgi:hypothetical protein